MDMQEPEKQRLEDEPMEPAEKVSLPSDEPVLSETDASNPDEEPASISSPGDVAEKESAEEDTEDEPVLEASSDDEGEEKQDEDSETPPPEDETEAAPDEDEVESVQEPSLEAPDADETEAALGEEEPEVAPDEGETESDQEPSLEVSDVDETETAPTEDEPETKTEKDEDPSDWFVVHCYSGYENKVRHNLEQRIETMGMKDMIFDVVVPTQEEIEVRDGKRRTVERHIFPGYVLVNMILTEESWYVVRNTPGVTGFVGMGNTPTPLRPEEVAQIVKRMEADAPTVKVTFKVGERVRIIDGPFNDFRGVVSEIDMERTKVRVMVSFFGRETPVELDFLQVEKS
jgi:transcriptional antiterminator NusG